MTDVKIDVPLTRPEEYRKNQKKVVMLSSGFTCRIRKMPPESYAKLLGLIPEGATPEESTRILREKLEEVAKAVIPDSVEEPRIVLDDPTPEALSVKELSGSDIYELLTQIYEFSGITGVAAEKRRSFPEEPS